MSLIYKIFRKSEWEAMGDHFQGAPIDLQDGYIHFSTAQQVRETARKYFADEEEIILAAVETGPLGDALKWEPSRGGDLFPHLYGLLSRGAIRNLWRLEKGPDGCHVFPDTFDDPDHNA